MGRQQLDAFEGWEGYLNEWSDRGQDIGAEIFAGLEGSNVRREGDEKGHSRVIVITIVAEEDVDGTPYGSQKAVFERLHVSGDADPAP